MRTKIWTFVFFAPMVLLVSCNDKKESSSSDRSDPAGAVETQVQTGVLAIVTGEISPADGADPSTVSGAFVAAEGHPEISAVTDENGKFAIENVLPGTIAIYVGSNDGDAAALLEGQAIGPTAYGLKLSDVVVKGGQDTDLGQQVLKKTGGFTGKVVFYSNPNKLDLTGSEVFVPGTGFIVKTDKTGAFTMSGLPPGKYDLRAQHTGFAVLDLKGVEVSEGATTSLGDLVLSISTGPEGEISLVDAPSIKIGTESIPVVTDSKRLVKFLLSYDNDAALIKVSDEPSFINKNWLPIKASGEWPDFKTDGRKTLYVMFSDLNGLESSPFKVEFIIDTLAPTGVSITIQNGWDQVASTAESMRATVAATDEGTGIEKMMVCTVNNFDSCGSWVAYNTDVAGMAIAANAYVKLKDYAGHVSAVASDTINLGSHTIIAGGNYAGNLRLYAAQSPFRYDAHIEVAGNLTIDAGVTLDHGGSSSIVKVLGRFKAEGTQTAPITITQSTGAFGGFDLSTSTADDNILRYFLVGTGVLQTNAFIKINGGTVANCDVTGSFGQTFVMKNGFKSTLIEDNDVTDANILINSGNATVIRGNTFQGNMSPAIIITSGSDTVISHNSMDFTYDSHMTAAAAIVISGGDATLSNNDIVFACTDTGIATGVKLSGGGTVTVSHNNFDIQSVTTTNVQHLESTASTIIADLNHYEGHSTTNPNNTGGGITSTNNSAAWPTVPGATCVGANCD